MGAAASIPVIDLSVAADRVVTDVAGAYERVGFAQVVGHGVAPALVAEVFEMADRFHSLPLDAKLAVARDENHRGYIALGTSTDRASELETVTEPNHSESFMLMRDAGPDDPDVMERVYLAGPNRWPPIDGFRPVIERYQREMGELARRVLGVFFEALGSRPPEGAFAPPTTWLRLLTYPARPAPADSRYGSAPHVDFGAITLLAQDEVGGLQVRSPDGSWLDVAPVDGAFVLNTGAVMRRWSNGRFLATPHRVRNPPDRARRSVAFFYDPHMRTRIQPLDVGTANDGDAPTFADLVRRELDASYDEVAG